MMEQSEIDGATRVRMGMECRLEQRGPIKKAQKDYHKLLVGGTPSEMLHSANRAKIAPDPRIRGRLLNRLIEKRLLLKSSQIEFRIHHDCRGIKVNKLLIFNKC